MVMATTRWPCSTSSAAAVALSTPPDRAATTRGPSVDMATRYYVPPDPAAFLSEGEVLDERAAPLGPGKGRIEHHGRDAVAHSGVGRAQHVGRCHATVRLHF